MKEISGYQQSWGKFVVHHPRARDNKHKHNGAQIVDARFSDQLSPQRTRMRPSISAIIFAVCMFGISLSIFGNHARNDHRNLRSDWETPPASNVALLYANATETTEPKEDSSFAWVTKVPKGALYSIIIILVLFSAFFSGLTLALMGLDTTGLEIVMSGDDPALSRAAGKIYPVRKNGNLLLCTLLLGNVAVNTLLGILMADITGGTAGFITSTAMIVIFGEIIPQATFSRYALQVGELAIPATKVIIMLFYVIAKPLAFCLDKVLGHELGTVYSRSEMSKLLEIHMNAGELNQDEGQAMKGALQYQQMSVEEVYTPLEKTFMVNVDDKLNFETMTIIFKTGYSRIPVYENNVSNVVGLLFVKDLIFINPIDETPVRSFVDIFGRGAHVVWLDDKLGEVLNFLKKGHCHMALVRDVSKGDGTVDPFYEVKGIITLEDIIEVILGDQILDETDAWEDMEHTISVKRDAAFDWARLRLLDANIVDQTLAEEEVRAVTAHLSSNYRAIFNRLSEKQLMRMIAATPVIELQKSVKELNEVLPSALLYKKARLTDFCTFILGGKVSVVAGKDNFRSDVSSWSLLAPGALSDKLYAPDFSAYVSSGPCRCLQFTRAIFQAAVAATKLDAIPEDSLALEETEEKVEIAQTSHFIFDSSSKIPIPRSPVKSLSMMEISSSSNVSDVAKQTETVIEQRGMLLGKLLAEGSVHGDLGVSELGASESNDSGSIKEL